MIGLFTSALLAGGFAVMNVFMGPLFNLNDIGSFRVRVLFIALAAAVYGLLLLLAAGSAGGKILRMLLRQGIVTAGFVILLLGINQKTYFYNQNLLPLIRAMDKDGLSAMAGWATNLSAPAVTLLYLITRGPVYEMYMVKLLCVGCFMGFALLVLYVADRKNMGIRAEAIFSLFVILPVGFLSAGCTPLLDTVCLALLASSLLLAFAQKECHWMKRAAALCYGLALSMSGLALYALPVFVCLAWKKRMTNMQLAAALVLPVLFCLPAIFAGVPAAQALLSLVRANFALPEYAAGAPGFMSLIPRALVEEMPIDMWMRHLPEVDALTNAQPYYTQAHFESAALGLAFAGAAVYGGVFAYLMKQNELSGISRVFALVLTALIVCPGATNAAWIAAAGVGLFAAFEERRLRLPAGMVIFAASSTAVYPMVEMTYLPMAAAFALCLCALLIAMDILPTTLKLEESEE